MGRIRVLSDTVANKIAAGEVVERPASVVKELLENSLDAEATDIRVTVEDGGRHLIRVADNGSGMVRDDAMLAFERHATSKLSDVKDLLSIATLGFRGEALPSIASISRLVLETRTANEPVGTRVEIAGGRLLSCDEAALAGGTTITVRDLFFNVPARKKFLRSDQTETAHIARLVTQYSLAHPEKSFQLNHGANELLSVTPVTDCRERVYQVFGARMLEDLTAIGIHEREMKIPPPYVPPGQRTKEDEPEPGARTFRLHGFVSSPQIQKLNRDSIYLFVNQRLIRDRLLLHALSSAYHNLIPPACYPFALLFLDCDPEEVDVNVHPSKTEVRFRHGSVVHDFVRDVVRRTLLEQRPVSSIPTQMGPQPGVELPFSDFTQRIENERFNRPPSDLDYFGGAEGPDTNSLPDAALPEFVLRRPSSASPRLDFSGDPIAVETEMTTTARLHVPATHGPLPAGVSLPESRSLEALADLRPLGQIHDSFIVAAGRDGLWIIDQHVAHERILFENILKQRAEGRAETQRLLMPIVLQLTPPQQVEYARIAGELNSVGFETEPFGNRTVAVKSAPAAIGPADIEKVLFEILEISDGELRRVSIDDLRRGIVASIACQAAIKINMHLDQAKMEWLIRELAATDYPMSCPHGRPIALRYSTRDILKSFHRI